MPAPPNTSATTAIDLGTLPASASQDVHDAGTTYTVWYKFTAPAGAVVVGVFGFGDLSIYRPTTEVYLGPASSPTLYLNLSAQNKPVQFPVTPGTDYFLKFVTNSGNPSPAVLLIEAEIAPNSGAVTGAFLINDDTAGFPAAIVDPSTGLVRGFLSPFPNGEGGDILTDGTLVMEDADTDELKLYDRDFTPIATLSFTGGDARIRAVQGTQVFYVGRESNPPIVRKVTADGAFDPTTWTLSGNTSLLAFATSNDEGLFYHAANSGGAALRRWDKNGATQLSNLAAGTSGYFWVDALVLGDDTILASQVHFFSGQTYVKRYSDDGTLLNTYDFGTTYLPSGTFPRLAYSPGDPASFVFMTHLSTGVTRILTTRVSDGTTIGSVEIVEYEVGIYNGAETATPAARFGISFSCPLIVLRIPITPLVDPSIPCCCCDPLGHITSHCCDGTRQSRPGTAGLPEGEPGTWTTPDPANPNGRLFPVGTEPAPAESFS